MLIHQNSNFEDPDLGCQDQAGGTSGASGTGPCPLSKEEEARLWDRIVRIHYLAADLAQPGVTPFVTEEMTRFVTGVLREWAIQAEEGFHKSGGGA